jgi:hypothetical protein
MLRFMQQEKVGRVGSLPRIVDVPVGKEAEGEAGGDSCFSMKNIVAAAYELREELTEEEMTRDLTNTAGFPR